MTASDISIYFGADQKRPTSFSTVYTYNRATTYYVIIVNCDRISFDRAKYKSMSKYLCWTSGADLNVAYSMIKMEC